jgi:hypothetical protein
MNQVFQWITSARLDPSKFIWSDISTKAHATQLGADTASKITYKETESCFIFSKVGSLWGTVCSPGENTRISESLTIYWDSKELGFADWLVNLQREINEPDLWSHLADYQTAGSEQFRTEEGNELFTPAQVEQIAEGIKRVEGYLKIECKLSAGQMSAANEKLDYLVDASKRLGRKDWFNIAMGVVFNIAIQLALSPVQAKSIWAIVSSAFSGVIKLIQ